MQTGHENIDGELQAIFEFRHLTFQEYLAARGYVEEQYPGRNDGKTLAEILEKHFTDERWREVISLAAVLAGRKAEDLIKKLTSACEHQITKDLTQSATKEECFNNLLYQCIRDEVQVTVPTLRAALHEWARDMPYEDVEQDFESWPSTIILQGKFGAVFRDVVEKAFLLDDRFFPQYDTAMLSIAIRDWIGEGKQTMTIALASTLRDALLGHDKLLKIRAALLAMHLAFTLRGPGDKRDMQDCFQSLSEGLSKMLTLDDMLSTLSASWALAWIGQRRLFSQPPSPELLLTLFGIWRKVDISEHAHFLSWALYSQKLLPRDTFKREVWGDCNTFLHANIVDDKGNTSICCALVVAWYRRSPWSDAELAELVGQAIGKRSINYEEPTIVELLENLGEDGRRVLKRLKKNEVK